VVGAASRTREKQVSKAVTPRAVQAVGVRWPGWSGCGTPFPALPVAVRVDGDVQAESAASGPQCRPDSGASSSCAAPVREGADDCRLAGDHGIRRHHSEPDSPHNDLRPYVDEGRSAVDGSASNPDCHSNKWDVFKTCAA